MKVNRISKRTEAEKLVFGSSLPQIYGFEDMKQRIRDLVDKLGGGADSIKRVAKRLGLATALVASIVAGGATGGRKRRFGERIGDNRYTPDGTHQLGKSHWHVSM